MRRLITFCIVGLVTAACNNSYKEEPYAYESPTSVYQLELALNKIARVHDSAEQAIAINLLWDSLAKQNSIPFAVDDSVAFLYKGSKNTKSVLWAGDFNGWQPNTSSPKIKSIELSNSKIFYYITSFPSNARLDYKIVVDGNWILDPANTYIQYSGFGPNSELRMPQWEFPIETAPAEGVTKGLLSNTTLIQSTSSNLGYTVAYRVYTPYNYKQMENLPVIYVTDGHEYADEKLGAMVIVMDNLIFQEKIEPIIAVFIDPRDPNNPDANRRMNEYASNPLFANFVADELVPQIDLSYKTNPSPEKRAILGTSMGGWNAAYFGLTRSDKFYLIGIHSPAFNDAIVDEYNRSPVQPIKVFMSTGVINDTQFRARQMKTIMESKGYPLLYIEVNEGHSWGNWRALTEEPLTYFFKKVDLPLL